MSYKAISILLCLLFGMTVSFNLQPDINNPLTVMPPLQTSNGAVFSVKFSFPAATANAIGPAIYGSSGLTYGQFIGLAFPPTVGTTDLMLDQGTTKHSCWLSDGTVIIKTTAVQPIASPITPSLTAESNTAYCQLTDLTYAYPLKIGAGITYTLKVTLTSVKIASTNYLRSLTLFTSTSANPEKMIIDSMPVLGTAALYADYTTFTPKALDIANTAVTVTSGPSSTTGGVLVYAYNQFDLTLTLKANAFITSADHVIVFTYPTTTVSPPGSVLTNQAAANDPLQIALKGNLSLTTFATGFALSGVGEDLVPNRQFQIVLKGWKALDSVIGGTPGNITVQVYYKNTYSILSQVSSGIFTVAQDSMTLKANHPEFWDVYRGGAWPIAFSFKTGTDLTNGGWVVIQQTNTLDISTTGGNKVTFIPSTCDFSKNDSSFDHSFGKRAPCYPLRTLDTTYTGASTTTAYAGSGFFFFLKGTITGVSKSYTVTIWAFFDLCGNNTYNLNPLATAGAASAIPSFTATIYKGINVANVNEARFTNQPALSASTATAFTGTCWNQNTATDVAVNESFSAVMMGANTWVIGTTTPLAAHVLYLNYREVFDWVAFGTTTDNFTNAAGFITDITAALTNTSTGYKMMYSSSNGMGTGSFFSAAWTSPSGGVNLLLKFALPLSGAGLEHPEGKWVWQFPAAWFVAGNPTTGTIAINVSLCYAGWSINSAATLTAIATWKMTKSPLSVLVNSQVDQLAGTNAMNTFAANHNHATSTSEIDTTNTLIPPAAATLSGAQTIVKIVSNYWTTAGEARWRIGDYTTNANKMSAAGTGTEKQNMAVFTSCLKWVSSPPAIASLYTYIDIQIKWHAINSNALAPNGATTGLGTVSANTRLIKLFPETGVVNDVTIVATTAVTTNPFISHTIYTGSTTDSVCLIELSGSTLSAQKAASSNTLVFWLFWGTLLETDYLDVSATYPVAPLNSNVVAYGLQSGVPMSNDNPNFFTGTNKSNLLEQFKFNNDLEATAGAGDNLAWNYSSSYIWFMASTVYFTSVNTSSLTVASGTEKAMYIPYYCPRYNTAFHSTTDVLPKRGAIWPIGMAAWITSSAYNNFTSVNAWVNFKSATANNTNQIKVWANKVSSANGTDYKKDEVTANCAGCKAAAVMSTATLKWSAYTLSDNNLYVFNGTVSAAGSSATCTGHVLLLSSSMTTDSTVTFVVTPTGSLEFSNTTKFFYVLGKQFQKGIYYGLNAGAPTAGNVAGLIATGATNTSAPYYTGVKKPTVDSFVSGTDLIMTDKVAYMCSSCTKIVNAGLTNYLPTSGANKLNVFFLDWYSNTAANWLTPSIAYDKTDVYKSDIAANFKTILSPPVSVPANTQLTFTANNNAIGGNTICGLVLASGFAQGCTVTSGTVTCTVPNGGTTYTVCCYNVIVTDPISFSAVTALFPADTGTTSLITGINTYLTTSAIYSANTQISNAGANPYSFVTNNTAAADVLTTKFAQIGTITYTQVVQESGIGRVTFSVNLPREPTRDMKLTLNGDLSGMYVPGNTPRCYATFGNASPYGSTFDNGDALIDSCSASGMQAGTSPVVVTTKRIVYKCGITFSKVLYISLHPVIVVNWNTSSSKSFKVLMALTSGDAIAYNSQTFNMAVTSTLIAKPSTTGQWDTLCTVSSVTPRIPGEVADYQFDFDLDTSKANLTNSNPNEVSIFFPYQYYGSFMPNVLCYQGGQLICYFTDEGILNIRFPTTLPIGSGKKISVLVVGITNPAIDTDYSFPCTINNTTSVGTTAGRTNLITGSGKLTGGINVAAVTAFGNLRFIKTDVAVKDANPRNITTNKFRIMFDNVLNATQSAITIANTPVIYVYFPQEYKLAWFTSKVTASIDEYTSDANNLITKTSTIVPGNVSQSGNRITITLTQASYTFPTNWRYWDITISNVVNPMDTTVNTNTSLPPLSQDTRPYLITLTNSNLTALYKTYTNVNTYSSDLMTTAVDNYLAWNRGNAFVFDNSKWVVDIYSVTATTQLNILTIKAGRYLNAAFAIKANPSVAIMPGVTTLSLTDNNFKTSMPTYSLSTSYFQQLTFMIGTNCSTAPGYYLVNFTSTNANIFASLYPVVITVDTSTKATISYQTPASIPAAGSTWVSFILSETNFEALNVNWVPTANSANDATSKITNAVIPAGTITTASSAVSPAFSTFSINNNSQTLGSQSFQTTDPNTCFTWATNTISFNISGSTAIIPVGLLVPTSFKYTNASNDATLTAKNSVRFNFTPPAAPIYIYCALVCSNSNYPADTTIMTVPQATPNTQYVQYYASIINNTTPIDIIFTGLVRGMNYKMRCIIYSTDGDTTKRTTSFTNIESYTPAGNSTTVSITPVAPQSTQCLQWQFLNEPGVPTRTAVVNYCQKLFSTGGWWNNGCIICAYNDLSYNNPGLSLPTNITCAATTPSKRLRMLQGTTTPTSTPAPSNVTVNTPTTLTVCPIPHPVCASDVSGNKAYADYFSQLGSTLNTAALFISTLNINNIFLNSTVPLVTITDATTPDVTKLVTSVTSSNANGAVSWNAAFSTPLACYWQIAAAGTVPASYTAVQSCTDASWCGSAKVALTTTAISATNLKAFTAGTTYNIYMACSNDIPFAQRFSNVQMAGTFSIPAPAPVPSANNTVVPTTSSSYLSFSLMAVFFLFGLLF